MITFSKPSAISRIPSVMFATAVMAVLGNGSLLEAASVRFLPLNQELADRKLGVQDSKGVTELKDLNSRKRSKEYSCETGEKPLLLVALDRQRPGGKPSGVEIAMPPEIKSPLVLIFADEDEPSGLHAVAVEDSGDGFPWGSLRFVNTTDGPLMIRTEKGVIEIPASYATVDINPEGEARNMGVQLYSDENPDAVLYSAVWEHDPNLRKLIFIVPAANPAVKELTLEIIPQDKRAKD